MGGAVRRPLGRLLRPEYRFVIQCYFDDSGKESQSDHRHVVIAGYIAHDSAWSAFVGRWRNLLLFHGIPELHMKDWNSICHIKGWDKNKRILVLEDFVACIRESQIAGLGIAIDVPAYKRVPAARRRHFGSAQEFCFSRIMRRIIDRMEKVNERDPIEVVFDRDFEFGRARLGMAEHLFKFDRRLAEQIANVSFADASIYCPLQAADYLAWITRRELQHKTEKRSSPHGWDRLFHDNPYVHLDYSGELWDEDYITTHLPKAEEQYRRSVQMAQAKVAYLKSVAGLGAVE